MRDDLRIVYDGGWLSVYDTKTNECVYEDDWTDEDFNLCAEESAKRGIPFCDYFFSIIQSNIADE